MTLAEARRILGERAHDGMRCPCCDQMVKIYRRQVYAEMAKFLTQIYRGAGREWCHTPSLVPELRGGDTAKLVHWGLIESMPGEREDGSKRTGWWRVTEKGEQWLHGRVSIPKYALIYNGEFLGFDGGPVTIHDALGERFDYRELMAA